MKRCVIFDLDGTLCDTSGDLLAAANVALAHLDRDVRLDPSADQDRATAVKGAKAMLRLGLSRVGKVDEAEVDRGFQPLIDAYDKAICQETVFYPGALDAVHRLRARGDAVGICTNKPEGLARKLMAALEADHLFHSLVGADRLPVRKPDPAHLVEAVRDASGDMARTVLIGDTKTDRDTATAARVPCILVTFAPGISEVEALAPEALLHDYADLEGLVDALLP